MTILEIMCVYRYFVAFLCSVSLLIISAIFGILVYLMSYVSGGSTQGGGGKTDDFTMEIILFIFLY